MTKKRISYSCTYTPAEILHSLGLEPIRALGHPTRAQEADSLLYPNFCGYVKCLIDCATEEQEVPDMVFVDSCDPMRRTFDVWAHFFPKVFSYLLSLPEVVNERSEAFFTSSLSDLIEKIERHYGVKYSPEALMNSIRVYNELRETLKRLHEALLEERLRASDYLRVLFEAQGQPPEIAQKTIEAFLTKEMRDASKGSSPRLLYSGSVLADPELAELVEDTGCKIVYFDTCSTTRFLPEEAISLEGDPLEAISKAYLEKRPCARMKHSQERFPQLGKIIEKNQIDGVIYQIIKFCDPWIYDANPFKQFLESMNIPMVRLEHEYNFKLSGQVSTRLQAFLEML